MFFFFFGMHLISSRYYVLTRGRSRYHFIYFPTTCVYFQVPTSKNCIPFILFCFFPSFKKEHQSWNYYDIYIVQINGIAVIEDTN